MKINPSTVVDVFVFFHIAQPADLHYKSLCESVRPSVRQHLANKLKTLELHGLF